MFERFSRVAGGELLPDFRVSEGIACVPALSSPGEALAREHERLLSGFDDAVSRSDSGEIFSEKPRSLLDLKAEIAHRSFGSCSLCEVYCNVDRKKEKGVCGAGAARIAKVHKSVQEESFLSPSASVLFSGCNFRCAFCNAWDISQFPEHGGMMGAGELAMKIKGFHGIRSLFLSGGEPVPDIPFILELLLRLETDLPVVLNSNFYASPVAMDLLSGVVDIYAADFKFGNDACAQRLARVVGYLEPVAKNISLIPEERLLVRHLALPGHFECCTKKVLDWIAKNKPNAGVNLMGGYAPSYKSLLHADIANKLPLPDFKKAQDYARGLGLKLVS